MPDRNGSLTFKDNFDVSRETIERLCLLEDMLIQWNRSINLVSKSTLNEIWSRHFIDSAQLTRFADATVQTWVDLGSGGGFPALVVSIMTKESASHLKTVMIESDARKCAFLRRAVSALNLNAEVITGRIEDVAPQSADIVSARALADLNQLLHWMEIHKSANGKCIAMKGQNYMSELTAAQENWHIDFEVSPSLTDKDAAILEIRNFTRVDLSK